MNAVGKLGSYISKGVYSVSTPFHPFGGAVDIIVVEQEDGSFKSSPWYVRFGKFQGVLKAREKVVKICVNGVEMDFHMCLENDGQACFVREVDGEEGDDMSSPNSWGDDLQNTRLSVKSKSCNFDGMESVSAAKIEMGNGNVVVRAKSHRSGILGYVFGRKANKEGSLSDGEKGANGVGDDCLEHAEIAADLLEVKWSTNCDSPKRVKDKNTSKQSSLRNGNENSNKCAASSLSGVASELTSSNITMDTEAYSPPLYPHPINCSCDEVDSQSMFSISGVSNSNSEAKVEKTSQHRGRLEPDRFCSFHSTVTSVASVSSEEDQLLFGDLDDLSVKNEKTTLHTSSDYDLNSSANEYVQSNETVVASRSKMTAAASNVDIPGSCDHQPDKVTRMAISLPNLWSHDGHLPSQRVDQQTSEIAQRSDDALITPELDVMLAEQETGNLSVPIDGSGASQRTWSLPFMRARNTNTPQPSVNDNGNTGAKSSPKSVDCNTVEDLPKVNKKILKGLTPTSEQLASLNLKQGKNEVIFTFSTPMLGEQKVDAQIYLWKWDMRIVISDVDGTITRSDVLGQFMPLVGVDWSQTGVVHLFSAIKENGYQMLFLSARSISQAYITRQFLVNLMQDGKGMPEGPVIISPDGLFPSLFREVVRRAPHEFKIACLEDIKALFPSDRNPFFAGFGNRDTDEISYLKVGIPKGKIFIINPKGEIVVNRHITNTKSYTSLHLLVNDLFPDFELPEQEDYNNWNFWKLPPPGMA